MATLRELKKVNKDVATALETADDQRATAGSNAGANVRDQDLLALVQAFAKDAQDNGTAVLFAIPMPPLFEQIHNCD